MMRVAYFATWFAALSHRATAAAVCDGTFTPISASEFTQALHPGWNPGNTLDAYPEEVSWGNPPLANSTFANAKSYGFKGIRLPVTWFDHMMTEPPYTVDQSYLQRVSEVVDMITSNGLYTMVNVHHDSFLSFDFAAQDANYTEYEERFYNLWYQIGEKLACESSMVAFEALNEPAGTTEEHAAELNKFNEIFLKAINDAGGFNSERVVVLGGLGDNSQNLALWFELPENLTNPYALTFHYYSPWDFVAAAWGKTIWGSEADKAAVEADFDAVRGNFTDAPVIVGEYGVEVKVTENAARWKWFEHILRTGHKHDFAMMLWDASGHFVVDSPEPWQDPTALNVLFNAAEGIENTLADSTEDGSSTEQWSSAYIWHRSGDRGEPVTDQSLPFVWTGNELVSIVSTSSSENFTLTPDSDYAIEGNNITFKTSYLSSLFSPSGTPGVKANLTLHFSAGADLQIQAVQWDIPLLSQTDFVVTSENAGSDLQIPLEFKGLTKMAAVKAITDDGSILIDDWTQWLGPLQQGRLTWSSHWDWNDGNVIVKSSVLQAVLNAGMTTELTFEFFPRLQTNAVNFTINVGS